jgi:hypothetical protein
MLERKSAILEGIPEASMDIHRSKELLITYAGSKNLITMTG